MRYISLLTVLLLHLAPVASCQHQSTKEETSDANKHMLQSSVEDLARAFDSSERDAWQKPEEVIKFLGDIKDKTVVDLGSGSGYFSVRLAVHGANVIAADVNDDFIEIIKEKRDEYKLADDKLRPVKVQEQELNLEPGTADIVFMVNTYHHISDRVQYFRDANAILKQDGKMVIVDFYKRTIPVGPPKNHKISKDKVLAELKEAGYRLVELDTTLLEYQYIITAHSF